MHKNRKNTNLAFKHQEEPRAESVEAIDDDFQPILDGEDQPLLGSKFLDAIVTIIGLAILFALPALAQNFG